MGFIRPYSAIFTGDQAVDKNFSSLEVTVGNIADIDILEGHLIEGLSLISGSANKVDHKLGRTVQGYFVAKRSADCRIWDDELTNTQKTQFLLLRTSATVTISLWVF